MKPIKPLFVASMLLFALALICVVAYSMIGAYVDDQGFVHEPFALIPLSYIFWFSALVCGALSIFRK